MSNNLFVCECNSYEHILIVSSDEEFCYISIHLAPLPILKRIWNGISYIFGKRSDYGNFEEIILGPEKLNELIKILQKQQ